MPIYEYVCDKCQNQFELMRPISKSSEPADCPSCKGQAKRIMSRFMCITTNEYGDLERLSGAGPAGASGCEGCSSSSCDTCAG